jgi:hypothetical protein
MKGEGRGGEGKEVYFFLHGGYIPGKEQRFFSLSKHPDYFWGPPSFLLSV